MPPALRFRPATAADRSAIEEMFSRCSVESRYARFLAPVARIPADHLDRILAPATGDEGWVVVRRDEPDTVVALGSWSWRGSDAELALIVEDSWQRKGIGSAFVRLLAERAWSAGVYRLTATVLRESRHVLTMLRSVLGPASTRGDGLVSHVSIDRCDDF